MSLTLEQAYEEWLRTSDVPQYPKKCPMCGSKVKFCQTVYDLASFICSSKTNCVWPLNTNIRSVGRSDFIKYWQYSNLKKEKKKERKNGKSRFQSDSSLKRESYERIGDVSQVLNDASVNNDHNHDVSADSNHNHDVSDVSKHSRDVSVVKKHDHDFSVVSKLNHDVSVVSKHNHDVSVVSKHSRDVSLVNKHNRDVSHVNKHNHDVSVVSKHNLGVSDVSKHNHDVNVVNEHNHDFSVVSKYNHDDNVVNKHSQEASVGSKHSHDVNFDNHDVSMVNEHNQDVRMHDVSTQEVGVNQCGSDFEFEKTFEISNIFSTFRLPTMMSPIHGTPRREQALAQSPRNVDTDNLLGKPRELIYEADAPSISKEINPRRASPATATEIGITVDPKPGTGTMDEAKGGVTEPDTGKESEKAAEAEVDPFVRPSSTFPTFTPFHFPSMLSPMPQTPRRGDSHRTPNYLTEFGRTPKYSRTPTYHLTDDLQLTDESDVSDFEKTPKASDNDRFRYTLSPKFEMQLAASPKSDSSSKVKVLLTRDKTSAEWNVRNGEQQLGHEQQYDQDAQQGIILPGPARPPSSQGNKLDKVVLNLKKSAGTNQWNIDPTAEKSLAAVAAVLPASESRRSRKSNSTPKRKIPAPVEKADDENLVLPFPADDQGSRKEQQPADKCEQAQRESTKPVEPKPTPKSANSKASLTSSSSGGLITSKVSLTSSSSSGLISSKDPAPHFEKSLILAELKEVKETPIVGKEEGMTVPGIKKIIPESNNDGGSSNASKVKTFLRKDRLKSTTSAKKFDVLPTLSNLVTMNTGVNVTISIPTLEEGNNNIDITAEKQNSWSKVYDLMKQYMKETEDPEVQALRILMKSVSGNDVDSLKQLQASYSSPQSDSFGKLTLHVGKGKQNIDLPTEDSLLDVTKPNESGKDSQLKVMLTSSSDGIEASELKRPLTPPNSDSQPPKRGRPKKPSRCTIEPGELFIDDEDGWNVDSAPLRHDFFPQQHYLDPTPSAIDDLSTNQFAVDSFFYHLQLLLQSFEVPQEWLDQGIDPYVAMMFARSQDPAYANIDFPSMIDLYLRLRAHQNHLQQQQQQQQQEQESFQHHQSHPKEYNVQYSSQQHRPSQPDTPINLSTSSRQQAVDRTYAELQTVRPGIAGDATEVLRRHNDDDRDVEIEASSIPGTSSSSQCDNSFPVKNELILPKTPSFQDSVTLESVRPAPASVSVVPRSMSSYVPASGKIGRGKLFISAQYQNSTIGPIYVETEHELKAVNALIQEKVGEYKAKVEKGSKLHFMPGVEALRARSILPSDIVEYLDKVFTQKGLKDHVLGRKKRNYPKRNSAIKVDPVTGKILHPGQTPEAGKTNDIPIRFIKREVLPDADLARSKRFDEFVVEKNLEKSVFAKNPLRKLDSCLPPPEIPKKTAIVPARITSGQQIPPDLASKILQDNENPNASISESQNSPKTPRRAEPKSAKVSPSKRVLRLFANGSSKENESATLTEQNAKSSSSDQDLKRRVSNRKRPASSCYDPIDAASSKLDAQPTQIVVVQTPAPKKSLTTSSQPLVSGAPSGIQSLGPFKVSSSVLGIDLPTNVPPLIATTVDVDMNSSKKPFHRIGTFSLPSSTIVSGKSIFDLDASPPRISTTLKATQESTLKMTQETTPKATQESGNVATKGATSSIFDIPEAATPTLTSTQKTSPSGLGPPISGPLKTLGKRSASIASLTTSGVCPPVASTVTSVSAESQVAAKFEFQFSHNSLMLKKILPIANVGQKPTIPALPARQASLKFNNPPKPPGAKPVSNQFKPQSKDEWKKVVEQIKKSDSNPEDDRPNELSLTIGKILNHLDGEEVTSARAVIPPTRQKPNIPKAKTSLPEVTRASARLAAKSESTERPRTRSDNTFSWGNEGARETAAPSPKRMVAGARAAPSLTATTATTAAASMAHAQPSQVFIRETLFGKVSGSYDKKQRHELKRRKREERKKAKLAILGQGTSQVTTSNVAPTLSTSAAEATQKPRPERPKPARLLPITDEERAIMDSLFQVGSIAVQERQEINSIPYFPQPIWPTTVTASADVNPIIEQFEMAQTQHPDFLTGVVESLEDLL